MGTVPTILTPCDDRSKRKVISVVTTTAPTGPALAKISAVRGASPIFNSVGFNPFLTQKRKAKVLAPNPKVMGLIISR